MSPASRLASAGGLALLSISTALVSTPALSRGGGHGGGAVVVHAPAAHSAPAVVRPAPAPAPAVVQAKPAPQPALKHHPAPVWTPPTRPNPPLVHVGPRPMPTPIPTYASPGPHNPRMPTHGIHPGPRIVDVTHTRGQYGHHRGLPIVISGYATPYA